MNRFDFVAIAAGTASGALLALGAWSPLPTEPAPSVTAPDPVTASSQLPVRVVADWAVKSGDAAGGPFVIVDKAAAEIHVFGEDGLLRGTAPVLVGSAIGDDTVSGIGERAIQDVLPHERTTPAGRFAGETGRNARGEDVVWVDYDAAVSMHPVLTSNPAERRLERLQTPTAEDNRISYGCINVPREFFGTHVLPAFAAGRGIVYILPEVHALREVFALD